MIDARGIAFHALMRIDAHDAYSNIVLDTVFRRFSVSKRDRAFATEIVYGVLRNRGKLDWTLEQFSRVSVEKMDVKTRNILRLALYQVLFLDSVPAAVACNEAVELAKQVGHVGMARFVNGVMRALLRGLDSLEVPDFRKDPVLHISIEYSHPAWLVERWTKRCGAEGARKLCCSNNQIPPTVLRTNTLKISRRELSCLLRESGITVEDSKLVPEVLRISNYDSIESLPGFAEGYFQVQDEASVLVSHVLLPKSGDVVFDVCGAPGGKSTHMAALMGNHGKILTIDISGAKLQLVNDACKRQGINIVKTLEADATRLHEVLEIEADRILIDAPCSGLGVLRRKPEIKWRRNPDDIRQLAKLQMAIIDSASKCLRSGGVLVYSTCTTEPEETSCVIRDFLRTHNEFSYADSQELFKRDADSGKHGQGFQDGIMYMYPHIHDTDGFFIARLKKA